MSKVSNEMFQKFVELYQGGTGTYKIARQFSCDPSTVRCHLIKSEVKLRGTKKVTNRMIQEFKNLYEGSKTAEDIAKTFSINRNTVLYNLRGVTKIRPPHKGSKPKRIQHVSLTPEKAYILGAVGPGDGCIESNMGTICLGVRDFDFALEFKRCLEKVYLPSKFMQGEKDGRPYYRAKLYSKLAVADLISYLGDVEKFRHFNERVPEAIKGANREIKAAYLRAVFDSQSTVVFRGNQREIRLCKTNEKVITEMHELLSSLGIRSGIKTSGKAFLVMVTGRQNLESFAESIGFAIERKSKKLREALLTYKQFHRPHTLQSAVDELIPRMISLKKQGLGTKKIASILGISRPTVKDRLRKSLGKFGTELRGG